MTPPAATLSNISLPLLIDYVQALLPTLRSELTHSSNDLEMLWVTQDKASLSALKIQLDKATSSNTNNKSDPRTHHLAPLPALDKQQVLERYELVCFWLPTLPEELIEHYIPLLMRFRDLYAAHLLVAMDSTVDLRAYGFTPFDIAGQKQIVDSSALAGSLASEHSILLWQFNLYDYKVLPNWLNNKYWANPENWDKGRW